MSIFIRLIDEHGVEIGTREATRYANESLRDSIRRELTAHQILTIEKLPSGWGQGHRFQVAILKGEAPDLHLIPHRRGTLVRGVSDKGRDFIVDAFAMMADPILDDQGVGFLRAIAGRRGLILAEPCECWWNGEEFEASGCSAHGKVST